MTTKKIIFGDGSSAFMTFEQILEQFDNLINKICYQTVYVCEDNKLEFLDVKQEMQIAAWRAFSKYDEKRGFSFSTYIFYWLKHARSKIITAETSQKRSAMSEYSMNNVSGEDNVEFMNFLEDESTTFEDSNFNFYCEHIEKKLKDKEKVLFRYLIVNGGSGEDLAKEWNISRQAVNKQLINLRKKIQGILIEDDMVEDYWKKYKK